MLEENANRFLEGLTKLSNETGVKIGGCGCCGSPWLDDCNGKGDYLWNRDFENIEYRETPPEED